MTHEELLEKFRASAEELASAFKRYDIANAALNEVVQRTGNYREYFFSKMKIDALAHAHARRALLVPLVTTEAEKLLEQMYDAVRDLNNITATVITEIERLDT